MSHFFAQPATVIGVYVTDVYIVHSVRVFLNSALIGLLTLAGSVSVKAITPDPTLNNYEGIPERNVFGLRPPPSQPQQEPTAAPLPKITLTGITTILDNKRALMKVAAANTRQLDPSKETSLILTEGQREGDIEVLQIDEKAGSVKVRNSGTVMVLTFEKDGAKLPATAAPPGTPGTPPMPSAFPAAPATNFHTLPLRNGNLPPAFPGRHPSSAPTTLPGVATATGSAVGGVPSPTGLTATPVTPSVPAAGQDLTPEEQAIIMELQRQSNPSNAALLPPTALTPGSVAPQPVQPTVPSVIVNPAIPGVPTGLAPQ